jgi:3-dehydro-L-gulonate 2-dehydrogenase
MLSGGNSTHQVDQKGDEFGLSQVFLCFDPKKLELMEWMEWKADSIIFDFKNSSVFEGKSVRFPGESTLQIRTKNLKEGVPVSEKLWARILTEFEK